MLSKSGEIKMWGGGVVSMKKNRFIRRFSFLILACSLILVFPRISISAHSTQLGDINEDGRVDIYDMFEILRILDAGPKSDRTRQISNLDKSVDNKITFFDFQALLKLIGGEPPELIYWPLKPTIKSLSNQSALPGTGIYIVTDDIGADVSNNRIKVLIDKSTINMSSRSGDSIRVVMPTWFEGGNIRLVVDSDTTNNIYLLLRDWQFTPNYEESGVPPYSLPNPLVNLDGTSVSSSGVWFSKRRPEIMRLFTEQVYGKSPGPSSVVNYSTLETGDALNGLAVRKQVRLSLTQGGKTLSFIVLMYIPKNLSAPVPVFLSLNFSGNHTISNDPAIILGPGLDPRGSDSERWPVQYIISQGYGLVTANYEDLAPDDNDGWDDGVHALFDDPAEEPRPADAWGNIAGWAWGMSRILDYLETDTAIDAEGVVAMGHSRLGKTALWAGAQDERFAMVVSNNSGCVGAALSRRAFGETVRQINYGYPHWFCERFKMYNDNEADLPVDQHMLLALIAPRPVYVASAETDLWSDPRGEFLSALNASPVYNLLTGQGLGVQSMPALNQPVQGRLSYHIRSGGHDVTDFDWEQYIKVADLYVK